MQIDIYVREKGGGREIRIPWLPEKITFDTGEIIVASYDIMNKGTVAVPTGRDLSGLSWESEFPGKNRTDKSMMRGSWQAPENYHNVFKDWKEKGTTLTVLVTGYPINEDVFVSEYSGDLTGAFGDIAYSVTFKEKRGVSIRAIQSGIGSSEPKVTETKRATEEFTTYTVKDGDTLWSISERLLGGGTNWEAIYNANKEIIESTATERWNKAGIDRDSQHGHWIFSGTTLKIPKG